MFSGWFLFPEKILGGRVSGKGVLGIEFRVQSFKDEVRIIEFINQYLYRKP